MKIFTFTITLLLISIVNFAQSSICPSYFRRNNGGCAGGSTLRLYFTVCPTNPPLIDSVYTSGLRSNITIGSPDASKCASLGYVSYCISGNMPPAATWNIYFHNPGAIDPFGCIVPEGGVLPIGIKSFFAKRSNNTVALSWQTSFEQNAQGFEVQRKSGNGFVTVAMVAATNSSIGSSYSFNDNNNLKGVSEYRLRLLSKDADASFSEIRSVKGIGANVDFTLFPNPAVRNAKISISDISEPMDVQVIDNTGRTVKQLSFKSSNTIDLNDLQIGIYRVRLVNKNTGEAITKTLTVIQ